MLDVLLRAGRGSLDRMLGGLFLVSDALSPLGLPDGKYPWDAREIEVVNGTARLADGTLSGTTLPLIKGAQNLVKWGLCSVEEAIALVTELPRCALGLNADMLGHPAYLLRWHQNEETRSLAWQRFDLAGLPEPLLNSDNEKSNSLKSEVALSKDAQIAQIAQQMQAFEEKHSMPLSLLPNEPWGV